MAKQNANEMQVGGDHYHNQNGFPHWDLVLEVPLSYLEGQTTKYVVRWREKGGAQDLRKAIHYLNKLEEDGTLMPRSLTYIEIDEEVRRFSEANKLGDLERQYVFILSTWQDKEELKAARLILFQLLDEAEGLIPESKPVPLTEENHHAPRYEESAGWLDLSPLPKFR